MMAAIPSVEVSHHAHGARIGRPDREADALGPIHDLGMGSQFLVSPQMPPLAQQVQIQVA